MTESQFKTLMISLNTIVALLVVVSGIMVTILLYIAIWLDKMIPYIAK